MTNKPTKDYYAREALKDRILGRVIIVVFVVAVFLAFQAPY